MRLYLSSERVGDRAGSLLALLGGAKRAAIIGNALDALPAAIRESRRNDVYDPAAELASLGDPDAAPAAGTGPKGASGTGVPPQIQPSPGLPERKAVARRQARVLEMLHTLPPKAQEAIKKLMDEEREVEQSARAESERRHPSPSPSPESSDSSAETAPVGQA